MKSFKVTLLFFQCKTWPEFRSLVWESFRNLKEAAWSLLFLLLSPIIIPFKFFQHWFWFFKASEEALEAFEQIQKRFPENLDGIKVFK